MEARITNGTSVNRFYESNQDGELLGVFQYGCDAVSFAKAKLAEDAARDWLKCYYVVADGGTGKAFAYRHVDKDE